jgi:hypothetical protein
MRNFFAPLIPKPRRRGWLSALGLTLVLTATGLPFATPAHGQSLVDRIQHLFGNSRPLRNATGSNGGGAVRGNSIRNKCQDLASDGPSLRSLSPRTNQLLTHDDQPTFWFYVPYGKEDGVEMAEFMLFTENWDYFLPEPLTVPLPESRGLVKLTLPDTTPLLEKGKEYNWHFSLICNANAMDDVGPWVNGWISRVDLDPQLASQAMRLQPEEAFEFYLQAGFWSEAFTALAENRDRQPEVWQEVLDLFDLGATPDLSVQTVSWPNQPIKPTRSSFMPIDEEPVIPANPEGLPTAPMEDGDLPRVPAPVEAP